MFSLANAILFIVVYDKSLGTKLADASMTQYVEMILLNDDISLV